MSTKREKERCFTINRLLVVVFMWAGVLWELSLPGDIFSCIGTLAWLYLPMLARWELKVIDVVKEYNNRRKK